ncbi:MAG: oligosaccharide flippase family protein [Pseudomonadota bacterium]
MNRREYLKHFMIILSGNGAAQVVNLLSYAFLARLYAPQAFGIFATFVAASAIPGAIACARFDVAVPVAPRRGRFGILWLCVAVAAFMGLVSIAGGAIYWATAGVDWNWELPVLLGLCVFLTGLCSAESMFLMRHDRYRASSASLLLRTGSAVLVQIGLGLTAATSFSLVVGFVFGLVAQATMLSLIIWKRLSPGRPKPRDMRAMFRRFRRQVAMDVPSTLLAALSLNLPVFLLAALYDKPTVGFFAISNRLAVAPLALFNQALSQIFYQKAARARETKGHFWDEMKFGLLTSGILSLVVLALIVLLARPFIHLYLGAKWSPSAEMLIILAPMLTVSSVAQSITTAVFVLRRPHWRLIHTVVGLALHAVAFAIAVQFHWAVTTYLIVVSSLFVVEWGAYALLLVVASRRHFTAVNASRLPRPQASI